MKLTGIYLWHYLGEKDHYYVDMADDVVRGSVVSHEVIVIHVCVLAVKMS